MKLVDIQSVVYNELLHQDLSIHYFVPMLAWGLDCLRDLHFDDLGRTKRVAITLDEFGEFDLTSIQVATEEDVVDVVAVKAQVGGQLRQLPRSRYVNQKVLLNEDDDRINWPPTDEWNGYSGYYFPYGAYGYRFYSVSTYRGEHKGRLFGKGHFTENGTWFVDWERSVVGVYAPQQWAGCEVELEYLSYQESNLGTVFPAFAARSIERYMEWQFKSRSRQFSRFEVGESKAEYYNERRILRARLRKLDLNDFRKAIRRYRRAVPNW